MCGIHGFSWKSKKNIRRMISAAESRGPDGSGIYVDRNITMGHNLLAITESPNLSAQPIQSGCHVLCFNGEIYNYKELRDDLKSCGHSFETDSDTEVLLKAITEWGDSCIDMLDGMFAIAHYNKAENTLLLARDSSGAKPLYWSKNENGVIFSSSIKSLFSAGIDRRLDMHGYSIYEKFGYIPGTKTLIKNVYKLYPGQIIKFDLESCKEIYNKCIEFKYENFDIEEVSHKEFRQQVYNSVEKCLMGNREIGLYLSGGLDSNMILHEMSKIIEKPRTFTTRFQTSSESWNGANSDADVALESSKKYNTEHTELLITVDDFLDAIDDCSIALEEPRASKNVTAYYLLNKELSRQGITVTLSGDGGDEVLTGYRRHNNISRIGQIEGIGSYWPLCDCKPRERASGKCICGYRDIETVTKSKYFEQYIQEWFPSYNFKDDRVNNQLYFETMLFLAEDFLIRNDKLGMNFSMEARFPFTTKAFKQYALSIPSRLKYKYNATKSEMRNATNMKLIPRGAYRGLLPDSVINKNKSGWSVSKDFLVSQKVKNEYVRPTLSDEYYPEINPLFEGQDFTIGKKVSSYNIKVMNFKVWAKNFKIKL
mgnify:CR=1 FL=1|tara:strand:- start:3696 stop:5483 length:1788 start_codon:yes stop_codon:yes gene_type:complete